jgi:hypothetical protein
MSNLARFPADVGPGVWERDATRFVEIGETSPDPERPLPPRWKAVKVGRTDYRVVPSKGAPSGHLWLAQRGTNALGEPAWVETQPPSRSDLEAALYAAS